MSIILKVSHSELDKTDLNALTEKICLTIDDATEIEPKLAATEGTQGTKAAEIVTLGAIALTFFSSGSAVALFSIFKAYFDRQPALELSFKDATGLEVKINAKNVDSKEIQQLIAQLQTTDPS